MSRTESRKFKVEPGKIALSRRNYSFLLSVTINMLTVGCSLTESTLTMCSVFGKKGKQSPIEDKCQQKQGSESD